MITSATKIRLVAPEDNLSLAAMLRAVLVEMGVPKKGTAYEDTALDCMYQTYDYPRTSYFVVELEGELVGGAGISPLQGAPTEICELQKMYFMPSARGKGIGAAMMQRCLAYAKEQEFRKCYLETMPYMIAAQKLYKKTGFISLEKPMGDTGHYNCETWMLKEL